MEYEIVYSKRRSVSLSVTGGRVIIKAPEGVKREYIDALIKKHIRWINNRLKAYDKQRAINEQISKCDISELKSLAKAYFEIKTMEYAQIMGLKFGRVEISSAKKKFGSCNSRGVIRYAYRLMLYPEEAREYVIVHELAHLVHMNHSPAFYKVIEKYMPDYKERIKLLK